MIVNGIHGAECGRLALFTNNALPWIWRTGYGSADGLIAHQYHSLSVSERVKLSTI